MQTTPAALLATPPPLSTGHTTVHVDPGDSSTLQIHVDSPFHPPQPCHSHLPTTDTLGSEMDKSLSISPQQAPQDTQTFTAAGDTEEGPYPSHIPQDIQESSGFEGEFEPSPALMQSFLSDAVAFHSLQDSRDPQKDAALLYPSQEEQIVEDAQDSLSPLPASFEDTTGDQTVHDTSPPSPQGIDAHIDSSFSPGQHILTHNAAGEAEVVTHSAEGETEVMEEAEEAVESFITGPAEGSVGCLAEDDLSYPGW